MHSGAGVQTSARARPPTKELLQLIPKVDGVNTSEDLLAYTFCEAERDGKKAKQRRVTYEQSDAAVVVVWCRLRLPDNVAECKYWTQTVDVRMTVIATRPQVRRVLSVQDVTSADTHTSIIQTLSET